LSGLHALLDAAQRKTLVEKARTRQASAPRGTDRPRRFARPDRSTRPMERWTKDLELDAEQQKKVEALKDERPGPGAKPRGRRCCG
jgi:hypothetical protein